MPGPSFPPGSTDMGPFARVACWLAQGDNAFITLNAILLPPLLAVIVIGLVS